MTKEKMISDAVAWVSGIRQAGDVPVTSIIDGASHPSGYSPSELAAEQDGKRIVWDVSFAAGEGTGDKIVVGHVKSS